MRDYHKFVSWVAGIPVLIIILIVIIVTHETKDDGISRAIASKAVALAFASREECEQLAAGREQSYFPTGKEDSWYVKYMDYLFEKGYLSEELTKADARSAESYLTYGEAEYLAESVSKQLKGKIKATKKNRDQYIPKDEWWLFYDSMIARMEEENHVEQKNILIYGTPYNVKEAPAWTAYSDQGTIGFEGLALDAYIDCEISVIMRDSELIAVTKKVSDKVVYENVWLAQGEEGKCLVYVGNITRQIETGLKEEKQKELYNNLADITLEKGKLKKAELKKGKRIRGRVLSVKADYIEIEGYGPLAVSPTFQVFKTYGTFEKKKLEDILVGYDLQEFVVSDGVLCAALIEREFDAKTIRVLLMNTGFQGVFHSSLTLSCTGAMTISSEEGKEEKLEKGSQLVLTPEDERLAQGRLIITPEEGCEISIKEIERGQGTPAYGGRLEISSEEGGLVAVNELYLEEYLKKVVPSEMPASYEKEALKAQAVCARTYAYKQIQSNGYSQYGAHVDDSTNYQVYNNSKQDERTDHAVNETYGKILKYNGKPIDAFYFSTSCGTTTDGSVWGGDPSSVPYLKSVALRDDRKVLSWDSEEEFSQFIKSKNYSAYDSEYPMFRWETVTTSQILGEKVTGIGAVTGLKITDRGPGGSARELEITGESGNKTVTGQNQIRYILGNSQLEITQKDGKKITGWDSLPSGFFTVEKKDGRYYIYGGGYGHGAGMSQNGAQGMAKKGKTYDAILKFFYDGVEIADIEQP